MSHTRAKSKKKKKHVGRDAKQEMRTTNPFLEFPGNLHLHVSSYLTNEDKASVVATSKLLRYGELFKFYQPNLVEVLLQAVVDDRKKRVDAILQRDLQLVLVEPDAKLVIESQYTRQKFYAENPLSMAASRKQLEMVQTLLPYFDKLPQTKDLIRIKTKALSECEYKKENNEIVIPDKYSICIQSIMQIFIDETFPNGELSGRTKEALTQFRRTLLPSNAMTLKEAFDPELFLYACYIKYDDKRDEFFVGPDNDIDSPGTRNRNAFCKYVVGFAQGLLSPRVAEKWCRGLSDFVDNKKPISTRAAGLHLLDSKPFYRLSQNSHSGLGFDYLCGVEGMSLTGEGDYWIDFMSSSPNDNMMVAGRTWEKYLNQKQQYFEDCRKKPSSDKSLARGR